MNIVFLFLCQHLCSPINFWRIVNHEIMYKFSLFILSSLVIFSACTSEEKAPEEESTSSSLITTVEMPSDVSDIYKIVTDIEYTKDTMQKREMVIQREDNNVNVIGYFTKDTPLLIRAQYPGKEELYFMKNGKVMMLKELIFEGADTSRIVENQFFYNNTEVLSMRSRSAENLELLKNQSFNKIDKMGEDYRFFPAKANNSAIGFLYGQ